MDGPKAAYYVMDVVKKTSKNFPLQMMEMT